MRRALRIAAWSSLALIAGCTPEAPDDCRVGELVEVVQLAPSPRSDLVVVVDTHDLTDDARRAAAARLEAMVRVVVTGDRDRDGAVDFQPFHDLEVTVLTAEPGCGSAVWLPWRAVASTPGDGDAFASSVAAAVEALPSCERSVPIRTLAARVGALRASAVVGLLIVTDEDEPDAPGHALADAVGASPERAWLSMVAGFDPDVRWDEWDGRASPGCTVSPFAAHGAPGIVDAADVLGRRGVGVIAVSICATDWFSSFDAWVLAEGPIPCLCIPRPASPAPGERLACTVTEQLDPSGYHDRCAGLPGRDSEPVAIVDGFERCRVLPSDGAGSPGWYAGPEAGDGWCRGVCAPDDTVIVWAGEPGSTIEIRCVSIAPTPGCAP